jgi:selenocysteine-specific elongation factor
LRELSQQVDLSPQEVRASIEKLIVSGRALALKEGGLREGSELYTAEGFSRLGERASQAVASYHQQHPLRAGMSKEELRTRLGLEHRTFDLALSRWIAEGQLAESGSAVRLPDHQARLTPEQERRSETLLLSLTENPYAPPTDALPEPELLAYLEEQGQLVRVNEGVVFAADAHREMVERIVAHLKESGTITLAQVRDMFGTSRKYAQALLEHMDDRHITRRVGDERVLRKG